MNSLLVNVFSVYCLLHTSFVCCNSNDVNNDKDWWKHVIVYQIYPRSFQDSNGDGVGDIPGITSRLDYLKDLGIGAIWLSPFYESPMADFGYDVSNHTNIDPVFGTLDDFDVLVNEAHKRGIKIIADFIPNHTSDRHPWFIESRRGTDNHYSDYYMWHKGKVSPDGTRQPPNNWLSHFGGSAWTWDDVRGEYYLHQFAVEQPDLNYYKAEVRQDMMEVIQFWLNRDVDGFRVDAISTLFEDKLLRDEPVRSGSEYSPIEHNYLDHIYTVFSDEIHEVTKEWRSVMEENDKKTNKHTYMVMEVYDKTLEYTMKYYDSGADQPFNFGLVYLNEECGGKCVHKLVDSWFQKMPEGKWASFVLGNHDQKRITTRKGVPYIDALNILLLTLPGQPTTYYGEELGMLDIDVTFEQTQDPAGKNVGPELYTKYSRDPCRSPMQWDDGINAGFSTASTTWLPVHPTYNVLNVKNQQATPHSHYHVYKAAVALRQKPAFQSRHIFYSKIDDNIFSYLRFDDDKSEIYWVILNVGTSDAAVNKGDVISFDNVRYAKGDVILTTGSIAPSPLFSIGSTLNLEVNNFTLAPGDGVVLKLIPSLSSHDEL